VLLRLQLRHGFQRIKLPERIQDISVIPCICTSSMVHTIVRLVHFRSLNVSRLSRWVLSLTVSWYMHGAYNINSRSPESFPALLIFLSRSHRDLFLLICQVSYVRWYSTLFRCPTTVLARRCYTGLFPSIGSVLTGTANSLIPSDRNLIESKLAQWSLPGVQPVVLQAFSHVYSYYRYMLMFPELVSYILLTK
jgi:hypothetical protein